MIREVEAAANPLLGTVRVPPDKSVSHRAVILGAMATGTSVLSGVLDSADVRSTLEAVRVLGAGVAIERASSGSIDCRITGWGDAGPTRGSHVIDCSNSGTTVRLLMGVVCGWPGVEVRFVGDESLSRRPMQRITKPLSAMGASFVDTDGSLPVEVSGSRLTPIEYDTPVASAQVKTAILLAGLRAHGTTVVREPGSSRDHTERMLPAFDVTVMHDELAHTVTLEGPATPAATLVRVPGDPSSAAFVVAAALVVPGSSITLEGVALNPTRSGYLRVLERMGADITAVPGQDSGGEHVGTVHVKGSKELLATRVSPQEIPTLIDEIPILAVVAACASGTTVFEGVGELRVKESDRLEAIRHDLMKMGVHVSVVGETLSISGPADVNGADLDARGDHRLAMAWAVAGLAADPNVSSQMRINRFECVDVSYPGFVDDMHTLGAW